MKGAIHGILWLIASNGATKLLWAASLVLLMRLLGPESYGVVATVWAFAGLLAGMSDLGVGQVMVREGSRRSEALNRYFLSASVVKLVLLIPVWAVATGVSLAWLAPPSSPAAGWVLVLALAAATPLVDHFQTIFGQAMQVLHRLDVFSLWRTSYFFSLLVAFWLLTGTPEPLLPVSAVYFTVTFGFTLMFGWHVMRLMPREPSAAPRRFPIQRAMTEGAPFLATMLLALAYYRVDMLLLGFLASSEEAGIYSAQYQIIILLYSASAIIFTVFFPDLYRNTHDHTYMQRRFVRIARYLNLLAWLVTPWLFIHAHEIMVSVGGESFGAHYEGLRVLALMVPMFLSAIALNFLTVFDRLRTRIYCELAALGITLVGGILLIPALSVVGMALTADVAYAVAGLSALFVLTRDHQMSLRPVLRDLLRMSIAMAPAVLVLFVPFPRWWQGAGAFMALSLLSLTVMRFWDAQDQALFRETRRLIRLSIRENQ